MPNVARINGFRPLRYKNGSPWNGAFTEYVVPAADGTAMFTGDLVKLGNNADDAENYRAVIQAAASDAVIGVVIGFRVDYANLNAAPYRVASTRRIAMVVDDPNVLFEAQEDGASDPLELQDLGANIDFVVGSGSTTTGQSAMQIDSSTHGTTATLPLKLVEATRRADNEVVADGQANTRWVVQINNHQLAAHTGTAGVA
jgi:hypothetical protein